jgi:hypothetical protein
MSVLKPLYVSNNNAAFFTGLGTLANGSIVWSTDIVNTSNLFLDILVAGKFTTGSSGVLATGTVNIVIAASADGGTTYTTIAANGKLLNIIAANSASTTFVLDSTSVANLYGGQLPEHFKIGIVNNSGAAFTSASVFYATEQTQVV